jgi:hypothetical protein
MPSPRPPTVTTPAEAFTALELDSIADPNHRRRLAELALGGGAANTN